MDYFDFESFIHPDVLKAFLVKDDDVVVVTTSDSLLGSETLNIKSTDKINKGDKFLYNNKIYTVRIVDDIKKQLIINPLESDVISGESINILKEDYRSTLKQFHSIGESDCVSFCQSLINSNVQVRFDQSVYILKRAFIAMYTWILQNKAFIKDLNLSGVNIPKSQIYDHFYKLLEAEKSDLKDMRDEAMAEIARKQQLEADGKSGNGMVRYTAPNRSFFSGYRR